MPLNTMSENTKVIKTQSEPNYFPKGSFRERSSVTAPNELPVMEKAHLLDVVSACDHIPAEA